MPARTIILTLTLVLAATAMAGAPAAASPAAESKPTVVVQSSRFGPILFDGRGFVLYSFTRDQRNRSTCFGACAAAWPPYRAKGPLRAGRGVRASLLGRTASGQVTYAGRPLYYYRGDREPGQILCQDVFEFGGRWLVVRGNGKPVT